MACRYRLTVAGHDVHTSSNLFIAVFFSEAIELAEGESGDASPVKDHPQPGPTGSETRIDRLVVNEIVGETGIRGAFLIDPIAGIGATGGV